MRQSGNASTSIHIAFYAIIKRNSKAAACRFNFSFLAKEAAIYWKYTNIDTLHSYIQSKRLVMKMQV